MIDQEAGVLKQESTVRKIKPLDWIFFSRLNIKRPKSGCFSKHDEGDSNYTHSTGGSLMGVQLLSTMLDIKSETISLLEKIPRWLNWHQETRVFLFCFVFFNMNKLKELRSDNVGTSNCYEYISNCIRLRWRLPPDFGNNSINSLLSSTIHLCARCS